MTDALVAGADANGTPACCWLGRSRCCSRLSPFLPPAYQITYHHNTTNSNTATVDVLNPSARQYTVTNLKPESVYVFRITAQTRKGWGEAAEALVVTTEKRGNHARAPPAACLCGKATCCPGRLQSPGGDLPPVFSLRAPGVGSG